MDLRSVLMHEIGHFLGLAHPASGEPVGIMRTPALLGYPDPGIYTDDRHFSRDVFGTRARSVSLRSYNGHANSWNSIPGAFLGLTNLPVYGAIGQAFGYSPTAVLAKVSPARNSVAFYYSLPPGVPPLIGESWGSTTYPFAAETAIAVAANDNGGWIAAWPVPVPGRECGGVRIIASTNAFQSLAVDYVDTSICTRHAVSLTWNPDAARYVLAYRYGPAGQFVSDNTRVRLRRSVLGFLFPSTSEVTTFATDSEPVVACTSSGACGVSRINSETVTRTTRIQSFTVLPDGTFSLGGGRTDTNWGETPVILGVHGVAPNSVLRVLPFLNSTTGIYTLYWNRASAFTSSISSWTSLGLTTRHAPAVAFSPGTSGHGVALLTVVNP